MQASETSRDISKDLVLALAEVSREVKRAIDLFPCWPKDAIHAAAIVSEESGELIRATLRHRYEGGQEDDMKTEALHTAATAIRFICNIEGKS